MLCLKKGGGQARINPPTNQSLCDVPVPVPAAAKAEVAASELAAGQAVEFSASACCRFCFLPARGKAKKNAPHRTAPTAPSLSCYMLHVLRSRKGIHHVCWTHAHTHTYIHIFNYKTHKISIFDGWGLPSYERTGIRELQSI